VKVAFIDYFTSLFTAGTAGDMEQCLQHLNCQILEAMNVDLLKYFTREEVDFALKQTAPLKAPRPDGFPTGFFQNHWGIVGLEVGQAMFGILNSGIIPSLLNLTHIALIPKV
jgi:hypothetical protein